MALTGKPGDVAEYGYTGAMQSVTIPADGIYLLQCFGPGGGVNGGAGGFCYGYKIFKKGTVIYIGVGQAGGGENDHGYRFNGGLDGSDASNPAHWYGCHPGGGCTHMATVNGELPTLSENRDSVLLVAGGGAAGKTSTSTSTSEGTGGDGGGETGTVGMGGAAPGTQTSGYAFGFGEPCTTQKTGGGAGWFGGMAGSIGGSGGSGYIGGVPGLTYMGLYYESYNKDGYGYGGNDNGLATIKMIRKLTLPVIFNGTQLEKIIFNGTEITGLIVDGVQLFFERLKVRFAKWFTSTKTARKSRALT